MFGLFSAKKNFNAQVNSPSTSVEVTAGDNLLNAALAAGLPWPHNCRVGSCGTCRCRLVDGKIKPLNDFSYVLDGAELDAGMILACQTRLKSDVTVEVAFDEDATADSSQPLSQPRSESAVINSITPLTHDIVEVRIQINGELPLYRAGQYAEISIPGIGDPRSYSYARAPASEPNNMVSFFVRRVTDGLASNWLHNANNLTSAVTVAGPYGSFYLRQSDAPALCIAGGSGLAPVKAMLEQLQLDGFNRRVVFLFGARSQRDLYCMNEMRELVQATDQFSFLPVLSDEPGDSDWCGKRGMVTDYITQAGIDLPSCQAYLCGPPAMIDAAIEMLSAQGVEAGQIYFDKFLDASHLPGGKR